MTGRRWAFGLGTSALAVLAITGSRTIKRTEVDAEDLAATATQLRAALASVNGRLAALQGRATQQQSTIELARLQDRSAQILARIDSLTADPDDQWRGAAAGLRANVADLEYRVDLAEIATKQSNAAVDTLMDAWLAGLNQRLTQLQRSVVDSAASPGQADALNHNRTAAQQLAERLAFVRNDDTHDDADARRALAQEAAMLRRELRALERAMQRTSG